MEFLRSFLRRHLAGKPVVVRQMSAVFSGYTSICCLAEYSNDTVLTLKIVGEEKIISENYAVLEE